MNPCNNDLLARVVLAPDLPPAPSTASYTLPGGATIVSSTAALESAVSGGAKTIILDDGGTWTTLTNGGALALRGVKLYAETPGGVTLPFGIQAGGNPADFAGTELHGLTLDIDDVANAAVNPANGLDPSGVMNWGNAKDLVLDGVTIRGHGLLDFCVLAKQPNGAKVTACDWAGSIKWGGYFSDNLGTALATPIEIDGLVVTDVTSSLGSGLHLGHEAHGRRIRMRDLAWSGINTGGACSGATLSELDLDRISVGSTQGGVGVWVEDYTSDLVVDRWFVGDQTRIGVNGEWDHDTASRSANVTVRGGVCKAWEIGVNAEQGCRNWRVEGNVFAPTQRSAIIFHNNLTPGATWPAYDDGSTQARNTFLGYPETGLPFRVSRLHRLAPV